MPTFPTIQSLINYIDNNVKINGNEEITGSIMNTAENGIIDYIKKAVLNYDLGEVIQSGGDVVLGRNITVISTTTPDSISWGDNFQNEWYIVNMTGAIPLAGSLVYYDVNGNPISTIAANSVLHIAKAENTLWVQVNGGSGGGGTAQKQPKFYKVGTTPQAPTIGANTWTLPAFENSYVVLFVNGFMADLADAGDGNPYITKALGSDTLTIGNYPDGWANGDKLNYILITP